MRSTSGACQASPPTRCAVPGCSRRSRRSAPRCCASSRRRRPSAADVDLNPRFRFEAFVVGPSNRLAFTAAQAVAQNPGQAYNPLFLYGRSGLGKTHLLHAVGWGAMDTLGSRRAVYRTLEEFVGQYHAAVAAGQLDAFRRSTEEIDALLID